MKNKTIGKLKKELWKLFSLYIKLVYSHDGRYVSCYTCGCPLEIGTSGCHAGHCLSKSAYPVLYFEEMAVRPQCYRCNVNLGGNEYEFNQKLKDEIGHDSWQLMYDNRHEKVKHSREWYQEKIDYYNNAIKEIKESRFF